jgi:hypothetical protein
MQVISRGKLLFLVLMPAEEPTYRDEQRQTEDTADYTTGDGADVGGTRFGLQIGVLLILGCRVAGGQRR